MGFRDWISLQASLETYDVHKRDSSSAVQKTDPYFDQFCAWCAEQKAVMQRKIHELREKYDKVRKAFCFFRIVDPEELD